MASDASASYMECLLRIDTSDGWEKSVTNVLASFQDMSFEINPAAGFIYIKGKTNPQIILTQLKKGGKHATIHWISYGLPRDDQHRDPESGHNHLNDHDPFHHARDPYETYYKFNPPYYPSYKTDHLAQNVLHHRQHVLEHEPSGHSERRSSGRSYHHHCPVHSHHHHHHHHHSPVNSHRHSPPPSMQSEAKDQAINQPTSNQPSSRISIKKIIGKFSSSCLFLCSKK